MAVDAVFFDAYGTLFDMSGVAIACAAVAPRPNAFVAEWRRRQLEYSWLRSLMDRYADFEQVSADALEATAPAERILFVSSNAWDVAGATAFGFPSCWVNRSGASPERLGESATFQVKSLGDILRLIA